MISLATRLVAGSLRSLRSSFVRAASKPATSLATSSGPNETCSCPSSAWITSDIGGLFWSVPKLGMAPPHRNDGSQQRLRNYDTIGAQNAPGRAPYSQRKLEP